MFGVTESDQGRSDAALYGKLLRGSRKNQKRFATLFFPNVDIAPAHRLANPGTERFCHRFLACETRSQMTRREFHRHRIFDLAIGKNAVQKAISESIDGMLNAHAFDQIDTDAQDTHKPIEFATNTQHTRKRREDALALQKLRKTDISSSHFARSAFGVRGVFAPLSLLHRTSSGIIRHRGEHFFYGGFQSDPHRARNDGMTDVELG